MAKSYAWDGEQFVFIVWELTGRAWFRDAAGAFVKRDSAAEQLFARIFKSSAA
ncbi:hypothetical protein [Cohnella faecalis]|uniref:hypothetical protein n=1 Tax=Cohnella faecalis TaxID=2315694 RepID=UPI0013145F1C|nr:hypothetical protein [Cohnella faecalis]